MSGKQQVQLTRPMNNNIFNLTVSPVAIAIIGGGFSGSLVAANLYCATPLPKDTPVPTPGGTPATDWLKIGGQ